jgi:hypothetical protein
LAKFVVGRGEAAQQFLLLARGADNGATTPGSCRMSHQTEQAKHAFDYYIKGKRDMAWDPGSRSWVPRGTGPGDEPAPPPGLSPRALNRIAAIQDAETRGLLSHDAAQAEILQIIREET